MANQNIKVCVWHTFDTNTKFKMAAKQHWSEAYIRTSVSNGKPLAGGPGGPGGPAGPWVPTLPSGPSGPACPGKP